MARFDPPGSALGTPTPHADPAASGGGEAGGRGRCYHTSTTTQGGGRGRRPVYIGGHRSGLPLPLSAGVGSSHPIGSMASGQVTHPVRLDRPPLSDRGPVPPESLYCIGACPVVPVRLSSGPVALCLTGCGCGECCPPTHNTGPPPVRVPVAWLASGDYRPPLPPASGGRAVSSEALCRSALSVPGTASEQDGPPIRMAARSALRADPVPSAEGLSGL